jgi:hypothetical protein
MPAAKSDPAGLAQGAEQPFWELYLCEHRNTVNCWLHVFGTVASWILLATAVILQLWWLLLLVPVVGYTPAWVGHLVVEGNKPVSIRYPIRSLLADYRLTLLMLSGNRPKLSPTVTADGQTSAESMLDESLPEKHT